MSDHPGLREELEELGELLAQVVAEEVLSTWAELAYYRQGGPCPHQSHRSSDWLNDARRWVCGICRPPAGRHGGTE